MDDSAKRDALFGGLDCDGIVSTRVRKRSVGGGGVDKRRFTMDLPINDYLGLRRGGSGLDGDDIDVCVGGGEGCGGGVGGGVGVGGACVVSAELRQMRERVSASFDRTQVHTVHLRVNGGHSRGAAKDVGSVTCRVICRCVTYAEVESQVERVVMAILRSVLTDKASSDQYWTDATVQLSHHGQQQRLVLRATMPFFRAGSRFVEVCVWPRGGLGCGGGGGGGAVEGLSCKGDRKGHRCRVGTIQDHRFHAHYRRKVVLPRRRRRRGRPKLESGGRRAAAAASSPERDQILAPYNIVAEPFDPERVNQRISLRQSQLESPQIATIESVRRSIQSAAAAAAAAALAPSSPAVLAPKPFPDLDEGPHVDDIAEVIGHYFSGCLEFFLAVPYNRALLILHVILKYGVENLDISDRYLENECSRAMFYFTVEILSGRLQNFSKAAWETATKLTKVDFPNVANCGDPAHYASMSAFVCLQLDHQFADDEAVTRCPNAAAVPTGVKRRKPFVLQPTGSIRNRLLLLLGFLRHARSQQRRFSSSYSALAFPRDLDAWILLALKLIHLSGHFEPDVVTALYHLLNRIESTHIRKCASDPIAETQLRLHHVECLINYVRRLLGTTGHVEIVGSTKDLTTGADAPPALSEKSLVLFIPDPAAGPANDSGSDH